MSKIAIKGNGSGTATFTIEAPATNTDRIFELPDEAGIILSDASTIDSSNLQSDVYKQDNILGTVSESGGVPTGAIIERGSNANGEFVKYADGTMICTGSATVNFNNTSTRQDYSFPAAFTDTPSGSFNITTSGTPALWETYNSIHVAGRSGSLRLGVYLAFNVTRGGRFCFIGRWF